MQAAAGYTLSMRPTNVSSFCNHLKFFQACFEFKMFKNKRKETEGNQKFFQNKNSKIIILIFLY